MSEVGTVHQAGHLVSLATRGQSEVPICLIDLPADQQEVLLAATPKDPQVLNWYSEALLRGAVLLQDLSRVREQELALQELERRLRQFRDEAAEQLLEAWIRQNTFGVIPSDRQSLVEGVLDRIMQRIFSDIGIPEPEPAAVEEADATD